MSPDVGAQTFWVDVRFRLTARSAEEAGAAMDELLDLAEGRGFHAVP